MKSALVAWLGQRVLSAHFLATWLVIGGQVRKILDCFLVEFRYVVDDCNHAIGSDSEDAGPKLQDAEAFRVRLGRHLGTEDWGPTSGDCTSSIRLLIGFVTVLRQAFFPSLRLLVPFLWRS